MKFGLFGGAAANKSADTADSKGYDGFVDLIIEAEKLGYESIFMLNIISQVAARSQPHLIS